MRIRVCSCREAMPRAGLDSKVTEGAEDKDKTET
jgi:hypothetical protein